MNSCSWNSSLLLIWIPFKRAADFVYCIMALIYFWLTFSSSRKDVYDLKAGLDYLYHQARSLWKFKFFRPFVLTWYSAKRTKQHLKKVYTKVVYFKKTVTQFSFLSKVLSFLLKSKWQHFWKKWELCNCLLKMNGLYKYDRICSVLDSELPYFRE